MTQAYNNLKKHYPDGIPFAVKFAIDDAIKEVNKEFADWLEVLLEMQMDEYYMIKKIEAKIKELRSNPLPKQSVDGKGSEEK